MNVYVESNFVLEIALVQEQHSSCENILSLCEADKAHLVLPAFSIAEPYETLIRRAKSRRKLSQELANELKLLAGTKAYKNRVSTWQDIPSLLVRSIEEEKSRLNRTLDRILKVSETIPLIHEVIISATEFQDTLDLSPQDSIVYASVLYHLKESKIEKKCFVNRNSKDFDNPDIVDTLSSYNCKLLFRFDSGYHYIKSQTLQDTR